MTKLYTVSLHFVSEQSEGRCLGTWTIKKKKGWKSGKTWDLLFTSGSSLKWLFLNNQSFWPWDTCWPGSLRGREDCQRETGGWFHWKLKQKIARGTNVAITHLLGQLAFARELLHRNFQIYPKLSFRMPPSGQIMIWRLNQCDSCWWWCPNKRCCCCCWSWFWGKRWHSFSNS